MKENLRACCSCTKMRIWLISDLHIELARNKIKLMRRFTNLTIERVDGEVHVLILAGDIGDPYTKAYKLFIKQMAGKFDRVFVVTGNHEYYQKLHTMKSVDNEITNIAEEYSNVDFLQRSCVVYQGVRFLGCTLWTKSDRGLAKYMNDYTQIPGMTPERCRCLHNEDIAWLKTMLSRPDPMKQNTVDEHQETYSKTVVVTHHLPTNSLVAECYRDDPLNSFFATDLDTLVGLADVWCCGHSHRANHVSVYGCECYLNPVGYHGETSNFELGVTLEL